MITVKKKDIVAIIFNIFIISMCIFSFYRLSCSEDGILFYYLVGARNTLIEISIVAIIGLIGIYFKDVRFLILELIIFSYIHQMLLAMVCAILYLVITSTIGWLVTKKNIAISFFTGVLIFSSVYIVLSIFQNANLSIIIGVCVIFGIVSLGLLLKRNPTFKYKVTSNEYIKLLIISVFLEISIGKANRSLDYDSIWYGLRAPFVLNTGKGIFENIGTIGLVYLYPKGFETYFLPFSNKISYSFFYAGNICMTMLVIYMTYKITITITSEKRISLTVAMLSSSIPSIISMADTAKSDIFTLLFELILIYFIILYYKKKSYSLLVAIWSCFLYNLTLKPTSFVFASSIMLGFCATSIISYVIRIIKKDAIMSLDSLDKKQILIIVLSIFVFISMCYRNYIITGMPVNTLLGNIISNFGFEYKYPYDYSTSYERGIVPIFSSDSLHQLRENMYSFFFLPTTEFMDHVVIAWGSIIIIFTILGIVISVISMKLKFFHMIRCQEKMFITILAVGETLGCLLTFWWLNNKPDGNYFLIFYVLVIICFGVVIAENCEEKNGLKSMYISIGAILIENVIIACIVNWAWCNSFTEIKLLNYGFYNHKQAYQAEMNNSGCIEIYDVLTQDADAKVLAFGVHPLVERIPCVIESDLDISYWGNPKLMKDESSFKNFVEYEGYNYILICPDYLKGTDQAYKNICNLFTEQMITNLKFENDYVLLSIGECKDDDSDKKEIFQSIYGEMGYSIQSPVSKENAYDDGWIAPEASITLKTKDSGKIILETWDPTFPTHENGMISIYIDGIKYCDLKNDETTSSIISASPNSEVTIGIRCNFGEVLSENDPRSLSLIITKCESLE